MGSIKFFIFTPEKWFYFYHPNEINSFGFTLQINFCKFNSFKINSVDINSSESTVSQFKTNGPYPNLVCMPSLFDTLFVYWIHFQSFSHFLIILYVKKTSKVSSTPFFVGIWILHQILGLPYRVVLKIWSRRCCELTPKNEFQLLKSLVSLTLLVNANL